MTPHPIPPSPAWNPQLTRWDWGIVVATALLAVWTIWLTSAPVVDAGEGLLLGLLWPAVGIAWAVRLFETVTRTRSRVAAGLLGLGALCTVWGFLPFIASIFIGDAAIAIGLVAGLAVFAFVLWNERPRRVAWVVAPAIVVATMVLIASEIPAVVRFAIGEGELTGYADSFFYQGPSETPTPGHPITVGSVQIYDAEIIATCVRLTTAYVGMLDDYPAGIAYCPVGAPVDGAATHYRELTREWFRWGPQLVGPGSTPPPIASGTPPPGVPLPTLSWWPPASGIPAVCGGVGMGPILTLQGSEADGVYGLLNDAKKLPITWPPGYRATFDPALTVRAPDGSVVATKGEDLLQGSLFGLIICTEGTQIEMIPVTPP